MHADLKECGEELANTKRLLASSETARQTEVDEHGMTRTAKDTALHELTERPCGFVAIGAV